MSSIIIAYHSPCLDGGYSALIAFLYLKQMFFKLGLDQNNDLEILINTVFFNHDYQMINDKVEDEDFIENNQGFFYSNFHKNIFYIPIKPELDDQTIIRIIKSISTKIIPSKSILIMADYYGQSYQNIQQLCLQFNRVYIVDHHASLLDELKDKQQISNLFIYFDINKSGATLMLDFFSVKNLYYTQNITIQKNIRKILKYLKGVLHNDIKLQLKVPFQQAVSQIHYDRLNEIIKYIEDYDIKSQKYEETDYFITAMFNLEIFPNILKFPLTFYKLMNINVKNLLNQGKKLYQIKMLQIQQQLQNKKKIKLGNYIGYCLKSDDPKHLTEMGIQLAILSVQSNQSNLGVVYRETQQSKKHFKVSLRGCNLNEESICGYLANKAGGGGHPKASSFFIEKKKFLKLFT